MAGDLGQLALSVDLAPPSRTGCGCSGAGGSRSRPRHQHVIEASLCVRQCSFEEQQHNDNNDNNSDKPPTSPCFAKQLPSNQQADNQRSGCAATISSTLQTTCKQRATKQRLVFERIDKLVVDARALPATLFGETLMPSDAAWRVPFCDDSFDACFCFNLLNVRVVSARLTRIERKRERKALRKEQQKHEQQQQHKHLHNKARRKTRKRRRRKKNGQAGESQDDSSCRSSSSSETSSSGSSDSESATNSDDEQEAAANWSAMEQLTSELRAAILSELTRVVRHKGECLSAATYTQKLLRQYTLYTNEQTHTRAR